MRHEELKHFYTDFKPELVFEKVVPILTNDKLDQFKKVYKNHAKAVINKVVTHYQKVYEAHGRVFDFDFNGNTEQAKKFSEIRSTLYRGKDDESYWREYGHKLAFVEPAALHLKGIDKEKKTISMRVPIETVYDMEADEGGIKYVVVFEKRESQKLYHVYDDVNYWLYTSTQSGFRKTIDDEGKFKGGPHNAGRCPFDTVYDDNEDTDNYIVKRNPVSDSIPNLYSYVILKTFYENYKYFAAFGREIKPQARCSYRDDASHVRCESGYLMSTDPINHPLTHSQKCPECNGQKNTGVMGEVYEIPIEQQSNAEFLKALPSLYHRYDADEGVLKFQLDDITMLRKEILDDCIGTGFTEGGAKRISINRDQVRSNFDDQESNLVWFSERIEKVWGADIQVASNINRISATLKLKLGRKYFLKSTTELYEELGLLQESTSNKALIGYKIEEITMTENKHNAKFLQRKRLLDILQPFSDFTSEWVGNNREMLDADALLMYDRFSEVLATFEYLNGRLETFGIEMENKMARIEKIKDEFKQILNSITNGRETTVE